MRFAIYYLLFAVPGLLGAQTSFTEFTTLQRYEVGKPTSDLSDTLGSWISVFRSGDSGWSQRSIEPVDLLRFKNRRYAITFFAESYSFFSPSSGQSVTDMETGLSYTLWSIGDCFNSVPYGYLPIRGIQTGDHFWIQSGRTGNVFIGDAGPVCYPKPESSNPTPVIVGSKAGQLLVAYPEPVGPVPATFRWVDPSGFPDFDSASVRVDVEFPSIDSSPADPIAFIQLPGEFWLAKTQTADSVYLYREQTDSTGISMKLVHRKPVDIPGYGDLFSHQDTVWRAGHSGSRFTIFNPETQTFSAVKDGWRNPVGSLVRYNTDFSQGAYQKDSVLYLVDARNGTSIATWPVATGTITGVEPIFHDGSLYLPRKTHSSSVAVKPNPVPDRFSVSVYPNPFNPATTLVIRREAGLSLQLMITDLLGRVVHQDIVPASAGGEFRYPINAQDWSSGVYFYQVEQAGQKQAGKLFLTR